MADTAPVATRTADDNNVDVNRNREGVEARNIDGEIVKPKGGTDSKPVDVTVDVNRNREEVEARNIDGEIVKPEGGTDSMLVDVTVDVNKNREGVEARNIDEEIVKPEGGTDSKPVDVTVNLNRNREVDARERDGAVTKPENGIDSKPVEGHFVITSNNNNNVNVDRNRELDARERDGVVVRTEGGTSSKPVAGPFVITSNNNSVDGVKPGNAMDGGDVLEEALCQLGPFGPYQRYALTLLCLPNLLAAMYSLNYVFAADQVPFRCMVPECEGTGSYFGNETVQGLLAEDACSRYQPLTQVTTCSREDFHPTDTIECDAFMYEYYTTIYAEFGLACREWLRTLVGSVRNIALPLALILTGHISDRWGRRTAFCIFSACAGIMGLVKTFSINYYMYLSLEFLEAALGYGFASAAYVMVVELARPSLRAPFACATGVAYGAGGALFALLAWRLSYWRTLLRAIYIPALLLPLYWKLIDESPRWLHATSQPGRAVDVLRKAARWNKVTINDDVLKSITTGEKIVEKKENVSWLELVRSRTLVVRLVICSWCWIASAFVYYGLTINSVSLSGDKHVNFALNMIMEIVASLLIMMSLERFGRKKSIFASFILCGVACIVPFFISHSGTDLGLYFVGKLAATAAFNSLYVYTTELFPTRVRSRALATCSLVGRVGSVLAPQTPLLSKTVQAMLYGTCSLSAALALLAVPETRREPLPH